MDWLSQLRDFQTVFVGIVGFGGVIAAQFVNGRLARKRDEANLKAKKLAVTATFRAELEMFCDFFERVDPKKVPEDGKLAFRAYSRRTITPAIMADVGLIEPGALKDVLYALMIIDTIDKNLALIADKITDDHLGFSPGAWPIAAGTFAEAAKSLRKAIEKLDEATCQQHSANA